MSKPKRLPAGVTYNERATDHPFCVRVRMPDGRRATQYFATATAASEWRDGQLKLGDRMRIGGRVTIADTPEEIPTFAAWAETYTDKFCQTNRATTLHGKKYQIVQLVKRLGPMRLDLIDHMAILDYKKSRSADTFLVSRGKTTRHPGARPEVRKVVTKNTVNKDLACLRHMLHSAVRAGVIKSYPPIDLFPIARAPISWVKSADERTKLLNEAEAVSAELGCLVSLGMLAGLRKSEVLRLKWSDINEETGYLTVESSVEHGLTKSGRSRPAVLHPRLLKNLRLLKSERAREQNEKVVKINRNHEFIFPGRTGKGMNLHAHLKGYERLVKRLGFRGLTFHSLRHTFLTTLALKGANAWMIKEAAGHADISTSQLYVHVVTRDVEDVVKSL